VGSILRCKQGVVYGRAEPAPPRGGPSEGEMALRRKAQRRRETSFSRRDALCASALQGRTQTEVQHNQRGQTNARRPNGVISRWKQSLVYGRAEPAPPRGGLSKLGWPSGENPGITRRRFSRRGALCASALQGTTNGKDSHYCRWLGERSVV